MNKAIYMGVSNWCGNVNKFYKMVPPCECRIWSYDLDLEVIKEVDYIVFDYNGAINETMGFMCDEYGKVKSWCNLYVRLCDTVTNDDCVREMGYEPC